MDNPMTTNCTRTDTMIALAQGLVAPEEAKELLQHMRSCDDCSQAYQSAAGTIDFLQLRKPAHPGEEYFDQFYQRLEERIDQGRRPAKSTLDRKPSYLSTLRNTVIWRNRYRLAGGLAMLIVGVLVGRSLAPTPAVVTDSPASQASNLLLQDAVEDYLDQSKVLLIGFANMEVDESRPTSIVRQQSVARNLVNQAPLIRSGLERSDQKQLRELVADLEVILRQIANLESEMDEPALEIVVGGIDGQGLLLKLNMAEITDEVGRSVSEEEVVPLEQF